MQGFYRQRTQQSFVRQQCCVGFDSYWPEPYVSVQYMDRDLSPPGSPLMVLLQGLSELHFSACILCVCSPVRSGLFAVVFTCLAKSRPGGEVGGNVGCQRTLTVENTRSQELWRLLIP